MQNTFYVYSHNFVVVLMSSDKFQGQLDKNAGREG